MTQVKQKSVQRKSLLLASFDTIHASTKSSSHRQTKSKNKILDIEKKI